MKFLAFEFVDGYKNGYTIECGHVDAAPAAASLSLQMNVLTIR